jgi:hypothetical protein
MNEIADRQGGTTSGSALEAAHSIQVSAGSTGDRTALSADAGNSSNIGQLVALRPAGGSTPPPPPPPSPPPPSSPPPGSSVGTSLPGALPASAGRSFYVSPSGSDTAAGSVSAPWRTVQKALDTLQPGDTAYLRGGTYSTWVTMSRSGTASAPITVRSYPGERATLTGRFKITGSWFRLTDLTFDGRYQLDETLIYPAAPASNLEISRCEIMRAGLTGTSSHSGNGIYIAPGTSSIRVLYNSIHDNGTSDRYHHGIYASGTGHLIAGNVIRNNSAYGIQLYPDADSAVVAANTIVGNPRAGIVIGSDGSTTSSGNRVVDNVVAFNGEYGVRTYWGAAEGTGNVVQTNLLYGNPGGATYGSGLTVSGSIASDPAFVDRSGGDLRLQSGSPAVDRGVASWSTPYDVAGVARPKGAGVDLGAYER